MRSTAAILLIAASLAAHTEKGVCQVLPADDTAHARFQSEVDYEIPEEIADLISWMEHHPRDLNAITARELEALPFLTLTEAEQVIRFREIHERYTSVEQLRELGEHVYEKLSPFVTVIGPHARQESLRGKQTHIRLRAMQSRSDSGDVLPPGSEGSPWRTYGRVILSPDPHLATSILFEKDPGESLTYGFTSGCIEVKEIGPIRRFLAGDFLVEAGQGLVLWRGSALGKASDPVAALRRSGTGPQPYHFTDECNFLRGVGIVAAVGDIAVSLFGSRRSLAATVDDSGYVTSLDASGLFRSPRERQKLHAVEERLVGVHVLLTPTASLCAGLTCFGSHFDRTLKGSSVHEFTGDRLSVGGVDCQLRLGNVTLFGEAGLSFGAGMAGILGAIVTPAPGMECGFVYRDYAPDYHNIHANGYGEWGNTRNERGTSIGFTLPVCGWVTLSGAMDSYRSRWKTYRDPMPVGGHDIVLTTDVSVTNGVALSCRLKEALREETVKGEDQFQREIRKTADWRLRSARVTVLLRVSQSLRLKTRWEGSALQQAAQGSGGRGMLLYQDLQWSPSHEITLSGRIIFFDADSYETRLYEVEQDLGGVFAMPALAGRGVRWYCLGRVSLGTTVRLSIKYGRTEHESSLKAPTGYNGASALGVQCDIRI